MEKPDALASLWPEMTAPRAAPRPALWAAQALYPSVRCSPEPMGLVLAGLRGELGRGGRAAARHRWHLAHEAGTERRVHRRAEHAAHLVVADLDDGAALTEVKLGVGVGVRVGVGSVAGLGWVQVRVWSGFGLVAVSGRGAPPARR